MKRTGPGKVQVFSRKLVHFSLYNFDIDGHDLKPEHQDALTEFINPFRKVRHILLRGLASHTGTESYNRQLAARRVESVRRAIVNLGISPWIDMCGEKVPRILCPDIIGEEHGLPGGEEEAKHRAVWVALIDSAPQPAVNPAPKTPDTIPQTNSFQARVIGGYDIAPGVGPFKYFAPYTIKLYLEFAAVRKGKRAETHRYRYSSGQGLIIPGGIISVGAFGKGGWSPIFMTNVWVKVSELAPGMASLKLSSFESKKGHVASRKYAELFVKKQYSSLKFTVNQVDLGQAFKPSYFITEGLFLEG